MVTHHAQNKTTITNAFYIFRIFYLLYTVLHVQFAWVSIWSRVFIHILQGAVQGGRRKGRQKKRWEDDNIILEWTGLRLAEALREAEDREEWRKWLPDYP